MYRIDMMRLVTSSKATTFKPTPLPSIGEFKPLCFEIAPGATIDWHTHTPAFDEVVFYLDGTAGTRSNGEREPPGPRH